MVDNSIHFKNSSSAIILVVTPWFGSSSGGGVGTIVSLLCAELNRHVNVKVFIPDWRYKKLQCFKSEGIELIYSRLRPLYDNRQPLKALLVGLLALPKSMLRLWRFVRRDNINIIHIHYVSEVHFYFRLLRWLGGPEYVVTFHGSDVNRFSEGHWLSRWLTKFTVNGASRLIAVSRSLAESAKVVFSKTNVSVVRNGVVMPQQERNTSETDSIIPKPYCLCVGGITPVKGHDIAIRAWGQLSSIIPEWHLIIAGDGYCRKEYEELSESIGCNDRIHWLGFVSRERVNNLMLEAEIMLLPSRSEGLPCVVLEAGYAALPVVASHVGGIPEVIDDGYNGRLVPSDDPDALARVVMELIKDRPQREKLGEALKKTILNDFSAERMALDYLNVYNELLS